MIATPPPATVSAYSSGPIRAPLPASESAGIFAHGPVVRIVVRVRVQRPAAPRLMLALVSPSGAVLPLRVPRARVATKARGCRGPALRFDTDRFGTTFLADWQEAHGRWLLRARGRGTIVCWQLWITRGRPKLIGAHAEGVHAVLSYVGEEPWSLGLRITASRGGVRAVLPPVHALCPFDCLRVVGLAVRDLDGDGEPEVIAGFDSGGAHCCPLSVIYDRRGDGGYGGLVVRWPGEGVGYDLVDLDRDGVPEFVSASDFECAFVSCAGTVDPIRIWDYRDGRLFDVTARFPELVRLEARRYRAAYEDAARHHYNGLAFLGSWAADQFALGRGPQALAQIRRTFSGWRSGREFVRGLTGILREWGYFDEPACPPAMCIATTR